MIDISVKFDRDFTLVIYFWNFKCKSIFVTFGLIITCRIILLEFLSLIVKFNYESGNISLLFWLGQIIVTYLEFDIVTADLIDWKWWNIHLNLQIIEHFDFRKLFEKRFFKFIVNVPFRNCRILGRFTRHKRGFLPNINNKTLTDKGRI